MFSNVFSSSKALGSDTSDYKDPKMSKTKVLFLAANPIKKNMLKLDEEIRTVSEKIRMSDYRDSLELISAWATRPDDLLQALNQHRPHIVHFSGHGTSEGEIVLVDNNRNPQFVSAATLQRLFSTLKDNIQLVVLNACYSKTQAEAITGVIDCAIGMNKAVGDDAAIVFAASLYRSIGFGRSIREAFDQGTVAVSLHNLSGDDTPQLIARTGVDPARIVLVQATKTVETYDAVPQTIASSPGSIQAGRDVTITLGADTPNGPAQFATGLRYLRQRLYDLAIPCFLKAIEAMPDDADSYYYLALSLIKGARPKMLLDRDVKRIEQYLNTAICIQPKAKHYYLAAILNYDYYAANGLSTPRPGFNDLLRSATLAPKESGEVEVLLNSIILRDDQLISFIRQSSV